MISKSQISFIRSLHDKKNRDDSGLFIVEGIKMIEELVNSSYKCHSLFCTQKYIKERINIVDKFEKNAVFLVTDEELSKISTLKTPNEVLALVFIPSSYFKSQEIDLSGWSIMLDTVQDPGNLGTILRIADWFAFSNIIISEQTADVFNPKVVQSTMGSIFRSKIYRTDLLSVLENNTKPVYGALLDGQNLYDADIIEEGIVVMGNESKGISSQIRSKITKSLKIPSFGSAESLNVGVATAIFCSEIRRRKL